MLFRQFMFNNHMPKCLFCYSEFLLTKRFGFEAILLILNQVHETQCPSSIHTCWNSQSASISRSWNCKDLDGKYCACELCSKLTSPDEVFQWIILSILVDRLHCRGLEDAEGLNCFKELHICNLCEAWRNSLFTEFISINKPVLDQ